MLQVIRQFGRFPHRNTFLGRISSHDELEFVNNPKYRFDLPVKLTVDPGTGAAGFEFIMPENQNGAEPSQPLLGPDLPAEPQLNESVAMVNARRRGYIAPEQAASAQQRGAMRRSSISESISMRTHHKLEVLQIGAVDVRQSAARSCES